MWGDTAPQFAEELTCDDDLWEELTQQMADNGLDLLMIDLGDGVLYNSHPEIAVTNAWTRSRLREELARLREMGIEPIPKLNFSTGHDAWLREYSRMVSTPKYYEVCADLIEEACELFDNPRFFHLGMDEETAGNQVKLQYAVMRQHDLWWNDLRFLADKVEQCGPRPWVWSDYAWHNPEPFYERMPKSIIQSNWYYGDNFSAPEAGRPHLLEGGETGGGDQSLAYLDLDDHGYDQVPTASNYTSPTNFANTVEFCMRRIEKERLLGFLQTPWRRTIAEFRDIHVTAIDQVAATRRQVLGLP
jgi:hypothetical protein